MIRMYDNFEDTGIVMVIFLVHIILGEHKLCKK